MGSLDFVEVAEGGRLQRSPAARVRRRPVVGDGENVGVGGFLAIVVETDGGDGIAFELDCSDGRRSVTSPPRFSISAAAALVKLASGTMPNSHAIASALDKKAFQKTSTPKRASVLSSSSSSALTSTHTPEPFDARRGLLAAAAIPAWRCRRANSPSDPRCAPWRAESCQHGARDAAILSASVNGANAANDPVM